MNIFYKKAITLFAVAFIASGLLIPAVALAQEPAAPPPVAPHPDGLKKLQDNLSGFGEDTGLGTGNVAQDSNLIGKIAAVINVILGFLGIIAVIMIIYAGFKWMTAGGNEEDVTKAKANIKNAVIGLAIVLASFIIVNFAVNRLSRATLQGSVPGTGPSGAPGGVVPGAPGGGGA